jgi:hypothetical protein
MLQTRLVHTSLMGNTLTAQVVGGPQEGVLSPLLRNLVVDRLLVETNDLGFSTFGYGDDIIIVQGKFAMSGNLCKAPWIWWLNGLWKRV